MSESKQSAPLYESLPRPNRRLARFGPEVEERSVKIGVVTPVLGGAVAPRTVDDVDVIRNATLRGQLRFWWRALNGHRYQSPKELHQAESALWGRAADDTGGRSAVEVRVVVECAGGTPDSSDIRLYDSKEGRATPGAYALWPAREERRSNLPAAPRRSGTEALLSLRAPAANIKEIENVVRAWLLFGGYGARTRRGLGSLRVLDAPKVWLPEIATRQDYQRLFGRDIFALPGRPANDVPSLSGAALHVGPAQRDAQAAWTLALEWLKEFRQGTGGGPGDRAREPGAGKSQPQRPSISNWPEADKIRHLTGKTRSHPPRHNSTPAWPRAGFGLPIIGQFQKRARDGSSLDEPGPFELRWRGPDPDNGDRLASPLIVKAMPLAGGEFVPIALWLNRAYPANSEVVLHNIRNSTAPFDRLAALGDTPRFAALNGKQTLREAFLDWLHAKYKTTVVAA